MPWDSRRRRFKANLALLAKRDPRTARRVETAWVEHHTEFELHQTPQGEMHVKRTGAVWPPAWLPFLDEHRTQAAPRLALSAQGLLPTPLVFVGLGLGWEFMEGYAKTQKVFLEASSAIYVVEQKPEALAVLLHIHDWREILADARVAWFVGEDAVARFRALLESDTQWPLTDRVYALPLDGPADASTVHATITSVAKRRQAKITELQAAIADRYAGRDAAYWARRFSEAADEAGRAKCEPLRILCLTSMHTTFLQYSMRDCIKALDRMGHQTRLIIEPSPYQPLDPVSVLQAQHEFQPDLIFLLSRMRYEMTGLLHPAIPSLTWDQDQLPWVFDPNKKPQLAWNDFLMGFAAASAPRRFNWPAHRCMMCEMAGSADTYLAEPLSESELAPYRCDVSYVSHASATVEDEMRAVESWLPDEKLRLLFREVAPPLIEYWKQGGEFPAPIMTPLIDACEAKGWSWTVEELGRVTQVIQRLGDRAFRHVALEWVADWADRTGRTFHIYGNGWERHLRLAQYAKGPTRNGEALRAIYQSSVINLQLMGFGFLHQRALDGLMAGGFFLARRSGSDSHGEVMRKLEALLDEEGAYKWAALETISDSAKRRLIKDLFQKWGADPRTLNDYTMDVIRAGARKKCALDNFPGFEEIAFSNPTEFKCQADRFLLDGKNRRLLAERMRRAVFEEFSYDSRMRQMPIFIQHGFRTEAAKPNMPEAVRDGIHHLVAAPAIP
ncbi:MAG: glycosyltransferase family 1 protein [Phycisphaerales bacterium]|nr:glycosyltransferase family 1 protein [Phycisphaerales bacterium]